MQRALIIVGVILVAIGLAWPWVSHLPFGRLPGDIHVERDGFNFYFPMVTCVLLSVVLSLVLWWWRR